MKNLDELLDAMNADIMKDVIDINDIECSDRRRISTMKSAIVEAGLSIESMFEALTVAQLRTVAAELDIRISGRREELVARLLGAFKHIGTMSPEIAPTPPNDTVLRDERLPPLLAFEASSLRVWLQGEFLAERMEQGQMSYGFCPACKRRHPQQWISYKGSERSFYLCFVREPVIVDSEQPGAQFTVHTVVDYVTANSVDSILSQEIKRQGVLIASSLTEADQSALVISAEAKLVEIAAAPREVSIWQRLTSFGRATGTEMIKYTKVEVTLLPPFVSLQLETGDALAAFRTGWDAAKMLGRLEASTSYPDENAK